MNIVIISIIIKTINTITIIIITIFMKSVIIIVYRATRAAKVDAPRVARVVRRLHDFVEVISIAQKMNFFTYS